MHIHFIAIGGNAMHNIALALHHKGYTISGSDDEIFEPSKSRLQKQGLLPEKFGWNPERITKDIDAVILGMHARKDNLELLKALEMGMKVFSFPEFIFEQSTQKKRIVIGGSHGKTTITAMIMHVLQKESIDFDYLVGAQIKGFDVMVKLSHEASLIIIEGDEYLSSAIDSRPKFHLYKPHIAVISGIDWDHYNVFPSFENYFEQFKIFAEMILDKGCLIYCEEDKYMRKIANQLHKDVKKKAYGLLPYKIENETTKIIYDNKEFALSVFGKHNILNLHAAKLVCNELGISDSIFYENIQNFSGAGRRLETIIENDSTIVFQDFAHAPSKLRATVQAVKEQFPDRKLVACIELHTYSSLNSAFIDNYKNTMEMADLPIVYFNPHTVKMKKLKPLTEESIRESFANNKIIVLSSAEKLREFLILQKWSNANLLMMSSGNFDGMDLKKLGTEIVK